MFYVYVVRCADDTLYTGYTTDIKRRIDTHNKGKGARYTRARLPIALVHVESFATKAEALRRECALKRLSRRQKERLISETPPPHAEHTAPPAPPPLRP